MHLRPWIPRGRGQMVLVVWAGLWAVVVGLVFVSVTVLTIILWATHPQHAQTTPVGDLGFFALGAVIGAGFASQLTRRAPLAGVEQTFLAALALAVAGFVGGREEPLVGGLVLVAASGVLWWLRQQPIPGPRNSVPAGQMSWALALVAWVGSAVYAWSMTRAALDAGPSCFVGRCARGDRMAELAASAMTIAAVATLAVLRTDGWRLPQWSAGAAAMIVGAISVAMPTTEGSLGTVGGAAAVAWGVVFVAMGEREYRLRKRRKT